LLVAYRGFTANTQYAAPAVPVRRAARIGVTMAFAAWRSTSVRLDPYSFP
jgi:hypothetical protein